MALPATGTITMAMVKTELGITGTLTLTDSRVRALAGKPTGTINLSDLRGKSAAPSVVVNISGFISRRPVGGNVQSRGVFTVTVTGGTPTSYEWLVWDVYGMTISTGNYTDVLTVSGPIFNTDNYILTTEVEITCTVIVGGVSYSKIITDYYEFVDVVF